ncbi:MAG: hypothetical protein NXI04_22475 [Planctomycetaceae bacterium]|nr:hypothetical protein [Planctomycetaceae bacterium]
MIAPARASVRRCVFPWLCGFALLLTVRPVLFADEADKVVKATDAASNSATTDGAAGPAAVSPAEASPAQEDAETAAALEHLIRFHFEPGTALKYDSRQAVRQVANTPKGVKTDVSKVDQVRVFTVKKVDKDGSADLQMQFASVKMEIQPNDAAPVKFDNRMSPSRVPSIFRSTADKLRGAAPKYHVKTSGAPVDHEGKLVTNPAGQASFVFPLPQEKVAVGDTWRVQIPVRVRVAENVMRTVHLLRTFRLKAVENGVATITFATSIDRSVKNAAIKGQLIQSTPQGTITFDLQRGLVLKRVLKFNSTVINAFGARTMLSATGQTVETLLEDDAKVTSR